MDDGTGTGTNIFVSETSDHAISNFEGMLLTGQLNLDAYAEAGNLDISRHFEDFRNGFNNAPYSSLGPTDMPSIAGVIGAGIKNLLRNSDEEGKAFGATAGKLTTGL